MLKTICYKSKSNSGNTIIDIESLFYNTRQNNNKQEIKGILIYRDTTFFQILEGECTIVNTLYQSIKRDSRHGNIKELLNTEIDKYSFADFGLGYATISSLDALYGFQEYLNKNDGSDNFKIIENLVQDLLNKEL
ncbi:BLUF domain-containing protein [Winogradskyella ludwigii]|jgi:hypothetical protein|uniref:BLUF domain-containing protein n=1 Tax=Winogradskyella ludwigii TaxID=2686076 RepID=UPI0015CA608B|nr:BLUF domain-containing protein [Winogradskyella ludwigii]